jgi:geranylgeranyl diphosphate synthase type II
MADKLTATWKKLSCQVDRALERYLPGEDTPPTELSCAMRYSVFAGGKRLRPVLCLMAGKMVGSPAAALMPGACAIEMVHTYSLIHDDLPAMDDDDYRRGRLTSHKVFGEAMAILAGDGLLTLAFETITRYTRDPKVAAKLCRELAAASGWSGMVGGQVFDIKSEGRPPDAKLVEEIHKRKTAALIRASVRMGAIAGGARDAELRDLTRFGEALGLLFQVTDDILDEIGDEEKMGKRLHKDAEQGKQTYPRVHGLEAALRLAASLAAAAEKALANYGERAEVLRSLPRFILERTR